MHWGATAQKYSKMHTHKRRTRGRSDPAANLLSTNGRRPVMFAAAAAVAWASARP